MFRVAKNFAVFISSFLTSLPHERTRAVAGAFYYFVTTREDSCGSGGLLLLRYHTTGVVR